MKNKFLSSPTEIKELSFTESFSNNNYKYNELKNKEKFDYQSKNIPQDSKLLESKLCKVNGVDHSNSPFSILSQQQREIFLMSKDKFFK